MSSLAARARSEAGESDESATDESTSDTEFFYESVEGGEAVEKASPQQEAGEEAEEAEPVVEASFASAKALTDGADGREFFGAIAAMLLPLAKAALPTIAGAVVKGGGKIAGSLIKKGAKRLNPQITSVLGRLKQFGVNIPPHVLSKLESSEEFTEETTGEEATDEATLLQQQITALEKIIGPTDERERIFNTQSVPYKRICHLKIFPAKGTSSYLGTGFFIGPRTIVTAGHCVYIHDAGGWAKKIVVTPGRNASEMPFGSFTSTSFRSVSGWVKGQNRKFDYAVIQLSASDIVPSNIGAFGFNYYSDKFLLNKNLLLNTAGYPGDKASGTLWFDRRKAKSVTSGTISYEMDTMGGQSGSPVWVSIKDASGILKRMVVGIHTNGATTENSATRITKPVYDNLVKWRKEAGVTYTQAV
jgi:V8-like Glu-specific endopeptidase